MNKAKLSDFPPPPASCATLGRVGVPSTVGGGIPFVPGSCHSDHGSAPGTPGPAEADAGKLFPAACAHASGAPDPEANADAPAARLDSCEVGTLPPFTSAGVNGDWVKLPGLAAISGASREVTAPDLPCNLSGDIVEPAATLQSCDGGDSFSVDCNWSMKGLAIWFYRQGGVASFELIRDAGMSVYELSRLGLIEPVDAGRWCSRYKPDGDLAIEVGKIAR